MNICFRNNFSNTTIFSPESHTRPRQLENRNYTFLNFEIQKIGFQSRLTTIISILAKIVFSWSHSCSLEEKEKLHSAWKGVRTVAIYIPENQSPIPSPAPALTTPSSSPAVTPSLLEGMSNEISQSLVRSIRVLEQNPHTSDASKCGYHALKNALLALRIGQGIIAATNSILNISWFQDPEVLSTFYEFLPKQVADQSHDQADASVATLTGLFKQLQNKQDPKHSQENRLKIAVELISTARDNPEGISIVNRESRQDAFSATDETNLHYASNIVNLSQKSTYCHAFVIGTNSEGHWNTLVLHRIAGVNHWYGLDSWNNQTRLFETQRIQIERDLKEPFPLAKRFYTEVHDKFKKIRWLETTESQKKEKANAFLGPVPNQGAQLVKVFDSYLGRVDEAVNFMDRVGWLTPFQQQSDQEIKEFVERLVKVVAYYRNIEAQGPLQAHHQGLVIKEHPIIKNAYELLKKVNHPLLS